MIVKIFLPIIFVFSLVLQSTIFAVDSTDKLPKEMLVLKLPNADYSNWKEIQRRVTEKEGLLELIPVRQSPINWSELISIQYFSKSWNENMGNSIERIVEHLKAQTIKAYPGNDVTWLILEQNKTDIIYEWILHKQYENIPPQHEIVHIFLTENGFHRIAFTRQNEKMSPEEKEKWMNLFKKCVSIVSQEEAANIRQGFSLSDRFRDSLDLGETFKDWEVISTYACETGYTQVCRIPPGQQKRYVTECLEVTTMPIPNAATIDLLVEIEQMCIQENCFKKVDFSIIKRSPIEIIYCYTHPRDHLQLTGVVRAFVRDQGYHSVCYKRGLPETLQKDVILRWKERLEAIKVCDR